jgi:plasmid stabilization system protein ParE
MAVRRLEIHPAALAELKSAVVWYLQRSEIAADKFVSELDRGMDLISKFPNDGLSPSTGRTRTRPRSNDGDNRAMIVHLILLP